MKISKDDETIRFLTIEHRHLLKSALSCVFAWFLNRDLELSGVKLSDRGVLDA